MEVYKFGGASVATPERAKHIVPIIKATTQPMVIVVSAIGKTTNALEGIVAHTYNRDIDAALQALQAMQQEHLTYAQALLVAEYEEAARNRIELHCHAVSQFITNNRQWQYDYIYDQIVCLGELLSTIIMHQMLMQEGLAISWIDIRKVLITDDTYRDAQVLWATSQLLLKQSIGAALQNHQYVITQGFISGTTEGSTATLGREGSDYTAALIAAMLPLKQVTIWKDVAGLQNADPKLFPNTQKIDAITYNEVIEMAYYGAQIIHPKTIKPLQNHNIPLYVKCFLQPELAGTVIQESVADGHYPPLIALKQHQVLIQVTSRDFSFITEDNFSKIYAAFHALKIKVNLMQHAAISFVACINNDADKVKLLLASFAKNYKVLVNEEVQILTIRHYNAEIVEQLTANKQIILKQETRKTLQLVIL